MNLLRKTSAFSMVDLLLLLAALAAIALVVLPMIARSRAHSCKISCTNNLKQVGISFRSWSLDNNDQMPMQVSVTNGGAMELAEQGSAYAVFLVMSNDLATPKILYCWEDTKRGRRPANVFAPTPRPSAGYVEVVFSPTNNLSYFAGVDADATLPNRILAGDDHFQVAGIMPKPGLLLLPTNTPVAWRNERHPKQGNVAFADGSVRTVSTAEFRAALSSGDLATNRLALP